ncbi:GNAT family N-acetyltransferase [Candidatus Pacearchaeota archaeon]|nr:GNAT family N-acetyltransferase [Candidatus Pacearchaeota archaeon]
MKIRKATIKDAEQIADIECNSGYKWRESKKEELKIVNKFFKSKNLVYIISSKEISGYFVLAFRNKKAHLDFLSIRKKYHNKGIGTKLLKFAVNLAKKNAKVIQVQVWSKNYPAIHVYKKQGFQISKIKKRHYKNGDDKLVMEKILK